MKITPLTLHKIATVLGILALASMVEIASLSIKEERYIPSYKVEAVPIIAKVITPEVITEEIIEPLPLPSDMELLGTDLLMPEPIPVLSKKIAMRKKAKR
jgi:hypothetical protein